MKASIFGVAAMVSITAVTLFLIMARESEARMDRADPQYHRYKLQYSYNGKIWHDLVIIENGELSKNVTYLRRGKKVPLLRYWYTYIDGEGLTRAIAIPLTVEARPESKDFLFPGAVRSG